MNSKGLPHDGGHSHDYRSHLDSHTWTNGFYGKRRRERSSHGFGAPIGLFAGAAALIGHCFPVWLGFKGGKGVATFFGCLLATAWPIGLIAGAVWLGCAFVSRISSLSALAAAGSAPLIAFMMGYTNIAIMAAVLAVIIYIRHAENIGRIIKGTESRIGKKD